MEPSLCVGAVPHRGDQCAEHGGWVAIPHADDAHPAQQRSPSRAIRHDRRRTLGLGRRWIKRAGGTMRPVDGRDSVQVEAGDGSVFVTPGAGGYGEPA